VNALRRAACTAAFAVCALLALPLQADESAAWAALKRGGHVLLIRHAQTVAGVGDPPGFRVDDCATQRNLSEAGRSQSVNLGRRLRESGVDATLVLASRWCRCIDTAELAFGRYELWAPLDSLFGNRARESEQTDAVRDRVRAWRGPGTLVLVTHGANISALTRESPAMAEALVLAPHAANGFSVVGRIAF
jgi:broad specificity phosphatase PhoE